MGTQQDPAEHEAVITSAAKTTLHIEMHSSERQVLTSFREQFMRWVNDRVSTEFAQDVGAPQRISFVEGEADETGHSAILNLDLTWSSRQKSDTKNASVSGNVPTTLPPPSEPPVEPEQRFMFFPDPDVEAPRHHAASLFDGTTLHHAPSRIEWIRMERPMLLELMHKGVRLGVRSYRQARSTLRLARTDPSRVLSSVAGWSRSWMPGAVRVRMPKPVSGPYTWVTLRAGSIFAAVGFATLLLVVAAYESRTSAVPAPDQTARLNAPRSRDVLLPAALPAPETAVASKDRAATTPAPTTSPAANTAASASTSSVTSTENQVATKGDVAPEVAPLRVAETRRRGEAPPARGVRPAANVAPVPVVVRSETVGSLVVASEPAGAAVSINGVTHGYTPLRIENLAAGTRVVRLELPGYERWSWAVNVVANRRTPVTVKLQPEARRIGASN